MSKLTFTIAAAVIVVLGLFVAQPILLHTVLHDTVTITVTDKQRECTGAANNRTECKYIVYTENETLQNVDSMWFWKFDSSDVYRKLSVGETYEVDVTGVRVPFMSMYRNIVSVKNNSESPVIDGNVTTCTDFQNYVSHVHQHVQWSQNEEPYRLEQRIRRVLCD